MAVNNLEKLANYICSIRIENLPIEVITAAKMSCIDTIGGAIASSQFEEVPYILKAFLALSGEPKINASVWGTGQCTSVFQAVFLNGMMGHSLELDDVHTKSKCHIGTVVVPAALAMAECFGLSGAQVIEGIVAGYEAMARIGKGFGVADHRSRGWHVTGTAGTFGAAATAAKLLGLNSTATLYSLGIAGTQSSGLWAFLQNGATSKKMHAGRAAESGVVAAILAKEGMIGPTHILDAKDGGLYPATSGSYSTEEVSKDLGKIFEILNVDRKPYPCCRSMHPALDAVLELRKERPNEADRIKKIYVKSYEVGVKQCGAIFYPKNVSEAKFCMRYGVAVAYLDGKVGLQQFSMDRILDPIVQELASKVEYEEDREFTARYPDKWGCYLEIIFEDGVTLKKTVLDATGSVENPMSLTQIETKFYNLASTIIGHEQTKGLLSMLKQLEALERIPSL